MDNETLFMRRYILSYASGLIQKLTEVDVALFGEPEVKQVTFKDANGNPLVGFHALCGYSAIDCTLMITDNQGIFHFPVIAGSSPITIDSLGYIEAHLDISNNTPVEIIMATTS